MKKWIYAKNLKVGKVVQIGRKGHRKGELGIIAEKLPDWVKSATPWRVLCLDGAVVSFASSELFEK